MSKQPYNPYQPPEVLQEPSADDSPQEKCFWPKTFIVLQILVVFIGLGASFIDIHSILFTGPILSAAGIAAAIHCWRKKVRWGTRLGISGPAFSVFIFLLINIVEWGPEDAQRPVPIMGLVYLCAAAALAILAMLEIQERESSQRMLP